MEEFGPFFHDGKVRGVVYVEHLVESESSERGIHLAFHVAAYRHAKALAQRYSYGRSGADYNVLGRVSEGLEDFLGVVLLNQGGGGAYHGALSAGYAVSLGQVAVHDAADVGLETSVVRPYYAYFLEVPAHAYAAAAEHALGVVAHQMVGGLVLLGPVVAAFVAYCVYAQFGSQSAELAVAVPGAGEAFHPVVAEYQFQGDAP